MRCTCQNCGTYMVQDEKGLESRCVCPECFNSCSACMGTIGEPIERGDIRLEALFIEAARRENSADDEG